jgi:hypothetical protein
MTPPDKFTALASLKKIATIKTLQPCKNIKFFTY